MLYVCRRVYQGLVRLIPNKAHLQRRRTVSELVTQVALTKIDPKNCEGIKNYK